MFDITTPSNPNLIAEYGDTVLNGHELSYLLRLRGESMARTNVGSTGAVIYRLGLPATSQVTTAARDSRSARQIW